MTAFLASGQGEKARNIASFLLSASDAKSSESNSPYSGKAAILLFQANERPSDELVPANLERSRYHPNSNRKTWLAVTTLAHGLALVAMFAGLEPDINSVRIERPERLTVVQLQPVATPHPRRAIEAEPAAKPTVPHNKVSATPRAIAVPTMVDLAPSGPPAYAVQPVPTADPPDRESAPKPTFAEAPPAPDPTGLKQQQSRYVGILMAHLARHKRYPRELRDAGIQGRGLVLFNLTADGRIARLRLVRSTGSPELDRQIRAIFERAEPFPIPDWSRDVFQTSYTLPVDFTITS